MITKVFVVSRGESNQGGGVIGVRQRFDEAEILALMQEHHGDGWDLEYEIPLDSAGDGDTVKRWYCRCDYVDIELHFVK